MNAETYKDFIKMKAERYFLNLPVDRFYTLNVG
jgi:hypothetical protein